MQTEILIIGGGLSGLALALRLQKLDRDFHLIEARERLGGRIHAHAVEYKGHNTRFDLGPAWFWPGQPRIASLIDELGLEKFYQYAEGELMYEDAKGPAQRGRGFSSMEGSYRLEGSLTQLIDSLAKQLPSERLSVGQRAVHIGRSNLITTKVEMTNGTIRDIKSKIVVLALPPRVATDKIEYAPTLSAMQTQAMRNIPTWMAGHAKIVAIYERPFWRDQGLSGDAMSRRGPMVEIHDASPSEGGPYALFGFVGVPATARKAHKEALLEAAKDQLVRLFGAAANTPMAIVLQDWAFEDETATELDHVGVSHHPAYGLPSVLESIWSGQLILGSTESAPQFGGYLEGALEAADIVFDKLNLAEKLA